MLLYIDMNTLFMQVILLIGAALVLVKSTEVLTGALKNLARKTKLGQFGITAFILALATSIPELTVSVVSSLEGNPAIAVGNVLGSNIADLSVVIGGAAIVGGGIPVIGKFLQRDLFLTFLAGSLPLLMLVDSRLTRLDGVILLIVYVIYVVTVLKEKSDLMSKAKGKEPAFKRLFYLMHKNHAERDLGRFAVGVSFLLLASHVIVQLAEQIAVGFGVPLLLVALILVALGTSLPELVFEIRAVKEGNIGMVFGDLFGSIVANSTLVLGVAALISPFTLEGGLRPYLLGTIGFVGIFLVFWIFARSKKMLTRWEGVVLILLYLGFVVLEVMRL